MLRSSLFTASALALVASAAAQTPQTVSADAVKIPGAIKNAGIYHVATGTWTRTGGAVANFGPDTVYSNTAGIGYFTGIQGPTGGLGAGTHIDEGGLPGAGNGNPFAIGGTRDEYNINGFQIGYCDFNTGGAVGGWDISFYDEYAPCSTPTVAAAESISLTGLPAGGCWIFTVDLEGGFEFCMQADGGPTGWTDDETLDSFGWSVDYSGTPDAVPADAGFIFAGDPSATDPTYAGGLPLDGTNTFYGATSLCAGTGTGYLTDDGWWFDDGIAGSATTGCYFFGGYNNNPTCGTANPYTSFWMEIYADANQCGAQSSNYGTIYCNSNPNSTGVTTTISLSGSPVAANDDCLILSGSMPLNSFGFFITSETAGFGANPAGSQGNICVGGNIGRFVGAGQIKSSGPAGEISLDTNLGEWSLTAVPTAVGPFAAMTGTLSHFQLWHRDSVGGSATSNFSDAIMHTWL